MTTTTQIGDRRIEVKPGPKSVIYFSRGWREGEEGGYQEFWTVAKEDDSEVCTGRARPGGDAGDRFRAMKNRPQELRYWKMVCKLAAYLRPSTREEVEGWINDKADAPYAEGGSIGGKPVRVAKEGGRYTLVDKA